MVQENKQHHADGPDNRPVWVFGNGTIMYLGGGEKALWRITMSGMGSVCIAVQNYE
jgi:hypothetical protein